MILNTKIEIPIAIFLSVMHEFGHIIAFVLNKKHIRRINFELFSVDIFDENNQNCSYTADVFILLSGSVMNFLISAICFCLSHFFPNYIFSLICRESIFIGIINLLPISSLDGGQLLSIFLEKKFDFETAEKISLGISVLFLFPLSVLGFMILFRSWINASLLILCIYLIFLLIKREPEKRFINLF
jgi:stage IV sporulation protein FB